MLLVVDIGNTHTVFGLFDQNGTLMRPWRCETRAQRTEDEYRVFISSCLTLSGHSMEQVDGSIISCVASANVQSAVTRMISESLHSDPLIVGSSLKQGMPVMRGGNLSEVGADRIVNVVAAFEQLQQACLVIDFGTATTFDLIGSSGEYCGGVIAPGLMLSLKLLHEQTDKLPRITLSRPDAVIGRNTVHAMQSGLYWGYIEMVNGMIKRIISESEFSSLPVIATGGLAKTVVRESALIEIMNPFLTLTGLYLLYQKNRVIS